MERYLGRTRVDRRRVLRAGAALAAAGFAGCAGDGRDETGPGTAHSGSAPCSETAGTERTATDSQAGGVGEGTSGADGTGDGEAASDGEATTDGQAASAGENATEGPLDLREANVVGVEVAPSGDDYEFSVTLHHDDEDGYANWWQVETTSGERIGRRDLLHAHDTSPFTRSETVEVPDDVTCVVVRGRDQTYGYGGRVMLVDVDTGATNGVRQGPDPVSFEPGDCP